jgi:hypothetical protein
VTITTRPSFDLDAPDGVLVRRRWVSADKVEWALRANDVLADWGAVTSPFVFDTKYKARWRARYLIRLLVELNLHETWELCEHTEKKNGGYQWTVEYVGRPVYARAG